MAMVQEFNDAMIESYLKTLDYNYLKDKDGDYCIRFKFDDDWGCSLDLWIIKTGTKKQIMEVMITSDKQILKQDWGRCIMMCNTFNRGWRWPKAFLLVEDESSSTTGSILLQEYIDLEKGIHQELFDDYIATVISAGFTFWKWMHKEQGF